jgi:hypothetical protein
VFIGVSAHTYMSIYVCTVFVKKLTTETTIYKQRVVGFPVSQNGKYRVLKYMQLYNFTQFCLYI